MCGFVCVLNKNEAESCDKITAICMNKVIKHRGPDDIGYYNDEIISMGFSRLSIIDLKNGHQPLSYDNKRYYIVFNGEIYNYRDLRKMLSKNGLSFKTKSDTETILALYSLYKEKCVEYLRGMFAFVIWDRKEKRLFAARDNFGIKPLYYFETEEKLYLASESKSIIEVHKEVSIDKEALQHYFTYQYVPEDLTLHSEIKKLNAGHVLKYSENVLSINSYWESKFIICDEEIPKNKLKSDIVDALRNSVEHHLISDVSVGAFLSGGIDSTIITTLAREINKDILTFTVGFKYGGYSESDIARKTADILKVDNIYKEIEPRDYVNELPNIIWHMDDPLADPACVPMYFLAREASMYNKVVISGEGADELFGGYSIYREPNSLKMFDYIPLKTKEVLKKFTDSVDIHIKGKSFIQRGCTPIEKRYYGNARIFSESEKELLIKDYIKDCKYSKITEPFYNKIKNYDDISKMQYIDINTWLKGDILLSGDKMTMAHSLEHRVPFLDKEVFKVARTIRSNYKVTKNSTKKILREAFDGIIPDHVLNQKKKGFPVPIRYWLRDELYEWAFDIICKSNTDYVIDKKFVLKILEKHKKCEADYGRKLWTILIFMIWHKIYIEKDFVFKSNKKDNIKIKNYMVL